MRAMEIICLFGPWQASWPPICDIIKALCVTLKLLYIFSKKLSLFKDGSVYIQDHAFPVTCLPALILVKYDVKQRYIDIYIYLGAGKHPGPLCIGNK